MYVMLCYVIDIGNIQKAFGWFSESIQTLLKMTMHLICSPKFCMSVVFNSSWDSFNTQEKWKTKAMQNFGGQIRCVMGDVQVANAKTSKHLQIFVLRGWQVHVFVSTSWQCKRSIRELQQWTFLRSWTSGRLYPVWIKYSICGTKSED